MDYRTYAEFYSQYTRCSILTPKSQLAQTNDSPSSSRKQQLHKRLTRRYHLMHRSHEITRKGMKGAPCTALEMIESRIWSVVNFWEKWNSVLVKSNENKCG